MGLKVNKNDNNEYQLISSVSDESYHPDKEWISEDEAKVILINKTIWKFIEDTIKIDMEFPSGYFVNDKYHRDSTKPSFNEMLGEALDSEDCDKILGQKFKEIHKRLKLKFSI